MALLSSSADYTDRDFESLRRRMRGLVLSVFPAWSDDSVANFGNILVELYAFVGDMTSFYQDNQAGESRITTATQRKNLLALAKLLNYTPKGAAASTAAVVFTLSAPVVGGRTVTFAVPATPAPTNPTEVRTQDAANPVTFQLTSPVTITAGNSTGSGIVENSQIQAPETFTSTGLANQSYRLTRSPYLEKSAAIVAADGTYTQVTNFLQSASSDKHFVAVSDDQDRVTITFGNGTNGKIPVSTITVNYKIGGGLSGNVVASSIVALQGSFIDSAGFPVTVSVTNAASATGGTDRESNEQIRENAPASVKSPTRTVSRDDFETHAIEVAGVERALMMSRNEDTGIAENAGNLFIVPAGIGFPTTALKNAVLDQFVTVYPHTITFSPTVQNPIYLDIGVQAAIFLKPGFVATAVRANIMTALRAYFALRTAADVKNSIIDFGFNLKAVSGAPDGVLALSEVENVIHDVDGVREATLSSFALNAYRVIAATTAYTSGSPSAVLVQAMAATDVPIGNTDFPRLKMTVLGGAIPDVDLTIDGTHYAPGP